MTSESQSESVRIAFILFPLSFFLCFFTIHFSAISSPSPWFAAFFQWHKSKVLMRFVLCEFRTDRVSWNVFFIALHLLSLLFWFMVFCDCKWGWLRRLALSLDKSSLIVTLSGYGKDAGSCLLFCHLICLSCSSCFLNRQTGSLFSAQSFCDWCSCRRFVCPQASDWYASPCTHWTLSWRKCIVLFSHPVCAFAFTSAHIPPAFYCFTYRSPTFLSFCCLLFLLVPSSSFFCQVCLMYGSQYDDVPLLASVSARFDLHNNILTPTHLAELNQSGSSFLFMFLCFWSVSYISRCLFAPLTPFPFFLRFPFFCALPLSQPKLFLLLCFLLLVLALIWPLVPLLLPCDCCFFSECTGAVVLLLFFVSLLLYAVLRCSAFFVRGCHIHCAHGRGARASTARRDDKSCLQHSQSSCAVGAWHWRQNCSTAGCAFFYWCSFAASSSAPAHTAVRDNNSFNAHSLFTVAISSSMRLCRFLLLTLCYWDCSVFSTSLFIAVFFFFFLLLLLLLPCPSRTCSDSGHSWWRS